MFDVGSSRAVAVLLAAGLGSRLRPLTDDLPKPLVQVAGSSILDRALDAVASVGVASCVVVTGYRRELVAARIASRRGVVEIANFDFAVTGTAHSLQVALISGAIPTNANLVVIEGDMVFDNILLRSLLEREGSACVIAPYAPHLQGSYAWIDGRGHVVAYKHLARQGPSDVLSLGFKTVNLCKVNRQDRQTFAKLLDEVLAESGPRAPLEFVFQLWAERDARSLTSIVTSGERWAEVDDLSDLATANQIFA